MSLNRIVNDTQQVCENGHQINAFYNLMPEKRKDYCQSCGKPTMTKCPKCGKDIQGGKYKIGIIAGDVKIPVSGASVPEYCQFCGSVFPWIKPKNSNVQVVYSKDTFKYSLDDIKKSSDIFHEDHQFQNKAAFIMMQFGKTKEHDDIARVIKSVLINFGIIGLRADDKQYHDDTFPNIKTYMHGCGFGIAVFEEISEKNFNPNVSLEVGYMMGLGKDVCLLKDKRVKILQSDLVGKLYKSFDYEKPEDTIPEQLNKWLVDKGITKK